MEMKMGALETSQNTIEKKVQDFQNKVDKKVEVSAYNEEIKLINFNLRKAKFIILIIITLKFYLKIKNVCKEILTEL